MQKETVYLRGHHLRILYEYAYYATHHKGNQELIDFRTKLKDERVVNSAVRDGHSKKHGINATETLKKAIKPGINIKLIDTLDDICSTCNYKTKKSCKEFMPNDVSAASDDRATIYYYGLKKRVYTSEYLAKRLVEKGKFF